VEPFITRYQGSHEGESDGERNHEIIRTLPTVDTSNRYGLVEPLLVEYYGTSKPYPVSQPVKTITTKDRFALLEACGLDIRFRMLKNHELKRAQGFPDDYKILGNTTEQTKQIGNAVPVGTAKALTMAII
jgi:DNA (cytosine-5)-methyltransferase 1